MSIFNNTCKVLTVLGVGALFWANVALGFSFVPTKEDWNLWPPYCKARFSVNMNARLAAFKIDVPKAEVEQWKRVVGEELFHHLHHFCAGLSWLDRAQRTARSKYPRKFAYSQAIDEMTYTFERAKADNRLYPEMADSLAKAYQGAGYRNAAFKIISELVSFRPRDWRSYVIAAEFYDRQGALPQAIDTLKLGQEVADKKARVRYYLAKYYLEKGDLKEARRYARLAHSGGVGTEWLDRKIREASSQIPVKDGDKARE